MDFNAKMFVLFVEVASMAAKRWSITNVLPRLLHVLRSDAVVCSFPMLPCQVRTCSGDLGCPTCLKILRAMFSGYLSLVAY